MQRVCWAICVALGGCAGSVQANRVPVEMTPQLEKLARDALGERMRDPESLQLTKLAAGKQSDGLTLVCGYYNAKNGFGGYAGPTPFFMIVQNTGKGAVGWERDAAFLIHAKCAANGLSLT